MSVSTAFIQVILMTKVEPTKGIEGFEDMFLKDEEISLSYIAVRDRLIFTNKRIVIINVQGLTGKKVEFHTIPYSKITTFSIETAGVMDFDSEMKVWVSGLGGIEIKFRKGLNIKEIGKFLTLKTLQ